MALTDIECSGIEITPCVAAIVDAVASEEIGAIKEGVDEAQIAIGSVLSGLNQNLINANSSVALLQAKFEAINSQIEKLNSAINAIQGYLNKFPCPELEPILLILQAVKELLALQLNTSTTDILTSAIAKAQADIGVLTGLSGCLDEFLGVLG